MGFSLEDGEKFLISSGSNRILERIYNNKPVWTVSANRAKLYSSRASAQKAMDKYNIQGTSIKLNELYVPVYLITRIPNDLKIMANIVWMHMDSDHHTPPYYKTPEEAQTALDREKLLLISEYHKVIMYCQGLKLPEMA